MVLRISTCARRVGNCFFTFLVSPLLRFCVVCYSLLHMAFRLNKVSSKLPLPVRLFPQPFFCRNQKKQKQTKNPANRKIRKRRKMVAVVKKTWGKSGAIKQIWAQKKTGGCLSRCSAQIETRETYWKLVFSTLSVFPLRVFYRVKNVFVFATKSKNYRKAKNEANLCDFALFYFPETPRKMAFCAR